MATCKQTHTQTQEVPGAAAVIVNVHLFSAAPFLATLETPGLFI